MKMVVHEEYAFLEDFIRELPLRFENEGVTLHNGRNCVKTFLVDGVRIVVKRFRRPNLFNRCVYAWFRKSKAERAYGNALELRGLGIRTPDPAGYLELYSRGLLTTCYLVTSFTDYTPLKQLGFEALDSRMHIFEDFVRFTVMLHEKGVCHDDYNLSNVLYKQKADGSVDFMLIDINRMRFGRMSRRACMANVRRLCEDTRLTYELSVRYAALRGWSASGCLAGVAFFRAMFERKADRKRRLKEWARGMEEN